MHVKMCPWKLFGLHIEKYKVMDRQGKKWLFSTMISLYCILKKYIRLESWKEYMGVSIIKNVTCITSLLRALHLTEIALYSRITIVLTIETCFYYFNDEILIFSTFFCILLARLAL